MSRPEIHTSDSRVKWNFASPALIAVDSASIPAIIAGARADVSAIGAVAEAAVGVKTKVEAVKDVEAAVIGVEV